MSEELLSTLRAVAYWFLPSRGGGQASTTLSCGHCGPVGAPCCRRCAQKRLSEVLLLRGEKATKEGE